jgi:hypothetical protein
MTAATLVSSMQCVGLHCCGEGSHQKTCPDLYMQIDTHSLCSVLQYTFALFVVP